MRFTRRCFLVVCGVPCFRHLFPALAAAAPRPLLGSSKVQFLRITAAIVLPGFSYDILLNAGDECGIGWYEYQGAPRAVLLIRRAGESMIQFLP